VRKNKENVQNLKNMCRRSSSSGDAKVTLQVNWQKPEGSPSKKANVCL
jgi:hypothetical protein